MANPARQMAADGNRSPGLAPENVAGRRTLRRPPAEDFVRRAAGATVRELAARLFCGLTASAGWLPA